MELLGNKIRILRRNKNITQEELARELSVSSQAVSKWERSIASPDISVLPAIARFFGITMDELFNYRLDAMTEKERFVRFLWDNDVLKFGQFPLKSGRISPYFINTERFSSGSQFAAICDIFSFGNCSFLSPSKKKSFRSEGASGVINCHFSKKSLCQAIYMLIACGLGRKRMLPGS